VEIHVNTAALSINHCCYRNATMGSLCVVTGLHVAVNNTNPLSVVMERQERFPFAQMSSYKIFRSVVDNTNVLRSSCKVHDSFV